MGRKRTMIRGAALSALAVGVSMAAMLLVGKVVTNALPPAAVAVYALVRLGADFLILVNSVGIAVALPKLIGAEDAARRSARLSGIFWGQTLLSSLFCVLLLVLWQLAPGTLGESAHGGWDAVWPQAWLVVPLLFVGTLRDTLLAGLAGMNAYALRAGAIVFMGAAQVVLVLGALWFWPDSVAGVCLALALGYGGGALLMLAKSGLHWRTPRTLSTYIESVRFSFPLYVNSLVTFFALRFDTVLVGIMLGREYLAIIAIYEIAKYIPMVLSRGLGALLIPFLPNFSELAARGELAKASALLNHALPMVAFAGYTATFAIIVVQEWALRLLFSGEYVAAAPVLGLLLAGIVLAVQAGLMGRALIALDKTWHVALANTLIAALSIAANLLLIPRFGLAGAGWAMVAAFAFGHALQTVWVLRAGISVSLRAVALPQLCLAAGALVLFWQPDTFWVRGLALACFTGLAFALGVIRTQDLREWLQAMRRAS